MSERLPDPRNPSQKTIGGIIFFSRWLQAPLYFGLIVAQGVYVYHFFVELWHLLHGIGGLTETKIMLSVLGLIDVVMIANLLVMVIVGGYETFVSRLNLDGHPDQPEWLSHVNAGILKVKLATALIGISSIHLLKTFIALGDKDVAATVTNSSGSALSESGILWQVVLHATFVLSALFLAWTDKIASSGTHKEVGH